MAKKFEDLRKAMSPEAQERSHEKAQEMMAHLPVGGPGQARVKKVHLRTKCNAVYCNVNNVMNWQESTLQSSPIVKEVTCLRCLRRYYRYPINAKVKGVLGP